VAAAISVATGVASLPLSALARERAKDVGLVTQDWLGYAGDVAKSQAIGAGFAALGGAALVLGMRRFGRAGGCRAPRSWSPSARSRRTPARSCSTRLFNDFKRLPSGTLRSDVLELARKAGVDVGEVYEIDASRRTTAQTPT
jgi:STE24 endopeptidase